MSTSKKKTIKFTALMTVLILTVTYFSLLTPTSAYFYQEQTSNGEITFAFFNVTDNNTEETKIFDETVGLEFEGATKFADPDEILFDEVAIEKEIIVTNDENGVDARIYVDVTPDSYSEANGLKYITFVEKITNEPSQQSDEDETEGGETGDSPDTPVPEELTKGPLKTEIEEALSLSTAGVNALGALDTHNSAQKNTPVILAPGESAKVRFIFWAEYGTGELANDSWQNAESVIDVKYNCDISITASQNNDKAVSTFKNQ